MVECHDCSLSETRLQVVPGFGNPNSPLVLVGEGPGKEEDWKGFPFIGRSGDYLFNQLDDLGLCNEDLWITNVVRCRSTVYEEYLKDAPPNIEATVICQKWLSQEIQIINPKVVLCIGGPASNSILKVNRSVSSLRGKWYTENIFPPAVVRVTYHPAYILRLKGTEYQQRTSEFQDDLTMAIDEARRRLA